MITQEYTHQVTWISGEHSSVGTDFKYMFRKESTHLTHRKILCRYFIGKVVPLPWSHQS